MNVKANIGIVNALVRITCGFTMLAWSTAKLSKKPNRSRYLMVAMMSAMKIGEGITRYCPVTDLLQQSLEMNKQNQQEN
ncbi:YgaP family membrane protein [Peribacillus deserti]|uniref:DUF2892 domain-containing protein n=1 Tax=Peribacillus deserti TaxID=673318 RepID=A0A2N5M2L7_9BACI|nr:DUF2892 domain-containing protein [Peribacillus deserti]PLT28616.1 DUF2892 domain-containing protein [Peribacillus deserti]